MMCLQVNAYFLLYFFIIDRFELSSHYISYFILKSLLLHWENFTFISFHLNGIWSWWQLSFLNQIEFHLVQNRKIKLSPRSYPIHFGRKLKCSFLSVASQKAGVIFSILARRSKSIHLNCLKWIMRHFLFLF